MKQNWKGRLFLRQLNPIAYVAASAIILGGVIHANAEPAEQAFEDHGGAAVFTNDEKNCMATAIYFEARGESERGQAAVGQVILNRVKEETYPDSICGVVYQNKHMRNACQFSFACDGQSDVARNQAAWRRANDITEKILNSGGADKAIGAATHYHADYVKPKWAYHLKKLSTVGRHIFYRT
jgi:spore germination cell wall hydrolase CwlJ-like protein